MKFSSNLEVNSIVPIYQDWENEQIFLGTAKLVKLLEQGRTFIIEDTLPESEQLVYNFQTWLVEWQDTGPFKRPNSRQKIRYLNYIGLAPSSMTNDLSSSALQSRRNRELLYSTDDETSENKDGINN